MKYIVYKFNYLKNTLLKYLYIEKEYTVKYTFCFFFWHRRKEKSRQHHPGGGIRGISYIEIPLYKLRGGFNSEESGRRRKRKEETERKRKRKKEKIRKSPI